METHSFDVRVRWFSQDIDVAVEIWLTGRPHQIEISFREPTHVDFEEAAAAIATIGGPLADRIADQARASGCPVSFIGRPDLSTLTLDADSHPGPGRDGKAKRLRRSLPQRMRGVDFTPSVERSLLGRACASRIAMTVRSSDESAPRPMPTSTFERFSTVQERRQGMPSTGQADRTIGTPDHATCAGRCRQWRSK
jgi:hypothetical protein